MIQSRSLAHLRVRARYGQWLTYAMAPMFGVVAGGLEHGPIVTFATMPASCGSFRKVSALQNPTPDPSPVGRGEARAADLAGRYLTVAQLQARPVLRLVERLA